MTTDTRTPLTAADDERAARLREAAEQATPGPWEVWTRGNTIKFQGIKGVCSGISPLTGNAAYIAAASPDNILALLDERDALRQRAAEAERERDAFRAAQHLPPDERDKWVDARTAYRELRVHHQKHHDEAAHLRQQLAAAEARAAAAEADAGRLRGALEDISNSELDDVEDECRWCCREVRWRDEDAYEIEHDHGCPASIANAALTPAPTAAEGE